MNQTISANRPMKK